MVDAVAMPHRQFGASHLPAFFIGERHWAIAFQCEALRELVRKVGDVRLRGELWHPSWIGSCRHGVRRGFRLDRGRSASAGLGGFL